MPDKDGSTFNRRQFIKTAGVTGFAGFSGLASGQETTTAGNGTATGTTGAEQTGGATITYWSVLHQQSQVSRLALENLINQFENETNHTVEPNWSITQSIQDGTWLQNMNNGRVPILYDSQVSRNGQFIDAGFVNPFEEAVVPDLSDEIVDGIEWNLDVMANLYAGFEQDIAYEMMLGSVMQEPFVVRVDHMEEAGLDPDEDFPPTNFEELVNLATTLQEDGPGQYGFQVHGSPGDLMDEISPTWAMSYGGVDGLYVNQDWTDTNLDSDAWKQSISQQVDLFRNRGLSAPNSDSTSDEDAVQLVISGQASMSQIGMLNHGIFTRRAPELVENGNIRYGPSWEGPSGYRGEFNVTSMTLCRPPNMDDAVYERKRQAAVEFMEFLLSPETQQSTFDWWGILPSNQSVWEQTTGTNHRLPETAFTIAEGSEYGWQAHPEMSDIQYNIPGPILQQAMTGDLGPEEACDQAAQAIREQVFN